MISTTRTPSATIVTQDQRRAVRRRRWARRGGRFGALAGAVVLAAGVIVAAGSPAAVAASAGVSTGGSSGSLVPTGTVFFSAGCSSWTPPASGSYVVTAVGSAGQPGANGSAQSPGGAGDKVTAEIGVTTSQTFKVCVDSGGGLGAGGGTDSTADAGENGGDGGGASSLFVLNGSAG